MRSHVIAVITSDMIFAGDILSCTLKEKEINGFILRSNENFPLIFLLY